jgi:hypothetical protein
MGKKKFPKYKLTIKQIRGIACIVAMEQPGFEGMMAEASQIANRTDIKGDSYATPTNIVKQVKSGWYAHGTERYNKGTSNALAIKAVRLAICEGFRTIPRYIDEHDCMSDVSTVKNGETSVKGDKSKWIPHKTVIKNRMSSTYTFYSFPGGYKTGVDPFGYTSKAMREKWGDFCYTIAEIESILDNSEDAKVAVNKIISTAEAEVGYLEKKSNKDLNSKTANVGSANYTKYGKWIGANGDYWCASFLSWIFYKAFGTDLGKKLLCGSYSAACETIRQNFKKMYQYKTSPKPGDVIFFSGTRHSGANHIGLVYKVADGKVYTIEGNSGGASDVIDNGGGVVKKVYKTSNSKILGYGHPDYSQYTLPTAEKPTENSSKPTQGTSVYPKCSKSFSSIVDALRSVGVNDTSLRARQKIAEKNGIKNYSGSTAQNVKMLELLKAGKLVKP